MKSLFSIGIYLFITILISACSSSSNSALRNKIDGKGKLLLDSTNPYLAPNKFLSDEAEASETLKGFISLKGSPQHIAFEDSFFSNPKLFLFYDDRNEKYFLEYTKKDWIISGPFPLKSDESLSKEEGASLFPSSSAPLINFENTRKDTSNPDQTLSTPQKQTSESAPQTPPIAKTIAEPKFEDVFHLVKFQGESLEFLAEWYTSDLTNSPRIKSINSIPPGTLQAGTTIRIPSYLLKRKDPPSEEDFKKFIQKYN